MKLKEEIELWLRKDRVKEIFPREVGLYRQRVNNIYKLFESDIVYSSIFSEWQKDNICFDTIFIDIDEHDTSLSFEERMSILDEKKEVVLKEFEKCGIEQRWYFTGNGYHLYCDFNMTKFKSKYIYKEVVRKFITEILDNDVSLIDFKIVGDIKRISRLPGKRHNDTKLYSIRIDGDWDWEKCVSMSASMKCYSDCANCNEWLSEYLIDLSKTIRDKSFDNIKITSDFLKEINMNPACVEKCLALLVSSGELAHQGRLFMTSWLLACGLSVDEILKIYKLYANDFKEDKTKGQIRSILRAKGYFYKCKSLKQSGICIFDDFNKCPFYVLSGGWLRNLVGSDAINLINMIK